MALKNTLRTWHDSASLPKRLAHTLTKAVWRTYQFASVPELRWQRITSWVHRDRYFQRSTFTSRDRYPELFDVCRRHLEQVASPLLLSFGCSTGEEVASLAQVIPRATIVGVDINRLCIRKCRERSTNERHHFCLRNSTEFDEIRNYDAVFCLAVFQRTENRNMPGLSESVGISFEHFEREIVILDHKLKSGGLLIIDQTDFSFLDTKCSQGYEILNFEGNCFPRNRPLFDRHNRKISDEQQLNRIFVKRLR